MTALVALLPSLPLAQERGPVTNLPMPRFVSMKTNEGYVRRGPSRTHRIDWIFKHPGLPLEITAEHGHWRRVRDRDGMGGWMHYSLLSGARTVLIETDMLQLRNAPLPEAPVVAQLELGVVARVRECTAQWCELSVQGHRGWAPKSGLWGVRPDETID
ncbi:aspartyl-trna synthetase [Roseovarius sp. SCSIO 43702]|nr:aspartyl-trna synthetase [Roseovarius sp. SCSIO 43702]